MDRYGARLAERYRSVAIGARVARSPLQSRAALGRRAVRQQDGSPTRGECVNEATCTGHPPVESPASIPLGDVLVRIVRLAVAVTALAVGQFYLGARRVLVRNHTEQVADDVQSSAP